MDGSYLAASIGNWAVSAGAVDKWWGPGWNNSLILSHNARPIPALTLQRQQSTAFKTPWLSWLGPWQFVSFAGQLESERYVPDAKLLGARLSFKPSSNWELGLSRTAQWGGEGRPQDWDSFKNLVLGKDNRGSGGIDLDKSNEPGNQLAGIDIKYNLNWRQYNSALYMQFIGEDEAGGLPSRGVVQAGFETSFMAGDIQHRLIFEAIDTTSESYSTSRPNYTYEHGGIYRSGYRYNSRAIGAAVDADSREFALMAQHYFSNGHQMHWSASRLEINRDNTNVALPGGSTFGEGVDTTYLTVSYTLPLNRRLIAEAGLNYSSDPIVFNDEALDDGGYLMLQYKY
jgi:hypothetical protein